MNFDDEPELRRLFIHRESDSIFEACTALDIELSGEAGCDDVTGIEEYEEMYRKEQLEVKKKEIQYEKCKV